MSLKRTEYDTWTCFKCHEDFIDPEDHPEMKDSPDRAIGFEPRMYWLGPTEPVCDHCAQNLGLPPIDKE